MPGVVNYFAGGNVRLRCAGLPVFMWSDSVAAYQGRVVQFVGRVRYRDSTMEMTADYGTYLRDSEKWEARGRVVLTNQEDGTTLRGPMLDYWRVMPGTREVSEMYADQRPTVTIPVRDSLNQEDEPYAVVGDRVRTRGRDQVWAGGRVTIDRSDFQGRGDSLFLDTGPAGLGGLIGRASARRTAADSFHIAGSRIDLALEDRIVKQVTASDSAFLATAQLRLDGDTIALELGPERTVEHAEAWGGARPPVALSEGYEARGDSLVFETPGQMLRDIRAYGTAWLGATADSAGGDRDWIAGDSVRAVFEPTDSAGHERTALRTLAAGGQARAYYRMRVPGQAGTSLAYTVADFIRILMQVGDSAGVDSVFALGVKDGVHLQPAFVRPDSTRADSARADTTGAARRPRPPAGDPLP